MEDNCKDFASHSYKLHQQNHQSEANLALLNTWSNKKTVDYWRHERMYSCLNPFLKGYPAAEWLTVGDGRYGNDANYILEKGGNALATDISCDYLSLAQQNGFIAQYQAENAEQLSFHNDRFDFVLCKESYHHFPRPMVALYEMLRVARKGIVLIEPNDSNIFIRNRISFMSSFHLMWQTIKNVGKQWLGKPIYYSFGNYEPIGNYVYTISDREIEKVALGLNYPVVAFKRLNDSYEKGVENEELRESSPLFQKIKRQIQKADYASRIGRRSPDILIAIILKEHPGESIITDLRNDLYEVRILSRNPYV